MVKVKGGVINLAKVWALHLKLGNLSNISFPPVRRRNPLHDSDLNPAFY